MLEPITIRYPFSPARRSLAVARISDLFGLSGVEEPHTLAENLTLDIRPGDLVLFCGPSGSGKSSLLREAGRQLHAVDLFAQGLPEVPLIEALAGTVEERLNTLSACGLSEARLLLRTPSELSDGQRYRFRMAYALQHVSQHHAQAAGSESNAAPAYLLCDEFCAILDRTLAKVLAFNVRKLVTRTGIGVLCATTHEDLVEDLNPNLLVHCGGEGTITAERRDVKKNGSVSPMSFGSQPAPVPTGRTSLGGIIAAITWPTPVK